MEQLSRNYSVGSQLGTYACRVTDLASAFRERLRAAVETVGRKVVARPEGQGRAADLEDVSVSQGGLTKILSGARPNPGIFTIKTIADLAGVSVGSLLGEQPSDRLSLRPSVRRVVDALDAPERYSFDELLRLFADAVESRPETTEPFAQEEKGGEESRTAISDHTLRLIETIKRMPRESKELFFEQLAQDEDTFSALRLNRR